MGETWCTNCDEFLASPPRKGCESIWHHQLHPGGGHQPVDPDPAHPTRIDPEPVIERVDRALAKVVTETGLLNRRADEPVEVFQHRCVEAVIEARRYLRDTRDKGGEK